MCEGTKPMGDTPRILKKWGLRPPFDIGKRLAHPRLGHNERSPLERRIPQRDSVEDTNVPRLPLDLLAGRQTIAVQRGLRRKRTSSVFKRVATSAPHRQPHPPAVFASGAAYN